MGEGMLGMGEGMANVPSPLMGEGQDGGDGGGARAVAPPERPLEMDEGTQLTLTIESKAGLSLDKRIALTKSAAGGWKGLHDPEEWKRMIYEARRTGSREEPRP